MQQCYSRSYRDLWSSHWWWRARHRAVMRALTEVCKRDGLCSDSRRLLDIGCAGGVAFDELSRFGQPFGVEPDTQLLDPDSRWNPQIFNEYFGVGFDCDNTFHVILMLDVLEHIEDDSAAVGRVCDLLEPGGTLLLTVPAMPSLWSVHDEANDHFRRYTKAGLERVVETAGLEIQTCRFAFAWSLPLLCARKVLFRSTREAYSVRVPPATVNSLFYLASRVELLSGTGFGSNVMAGSSLFVVASRPAPESGERDDRKQSSISTQPHATSFQEMPASSALRSTI